jgi:DnaJ like chaperone protein
MGIFDRIKRIVRANLGDSDFSADEVFHDSDAELRRIIDELRRPSQQQRARASARPGASQARGQSGSRQSTGGSAGTAKDLALKNAYAVLGCTPASTNDAIKSAYRKLMRDHHPDTVARASAAEQERAKRKAQEINTAYDIISEHRGIR